MKEIIFWIGGMKCDGCELTVRKALLKLGGIIDVHANHKTGQVRLKIHEPDFSIREVDNTLCSLGFEPIVYEGLKHAR